MLTRPAVLDRNWGRVASVHKFGAGSCIILTKHTGNSLMLPLTGTTSFTHTKCHGVYYAGTQIL